MASNCRRAPPSIARVLAPRSWLRRRRASCCVELAWQAAQTTCPAATSVTYTIKRDTDPYFGTAQIIAVGVGTPDYTDATVSNGTPYYYQVWATDDFGNQSQVSQVRNVTPSGIDGPDPNTYVDNVDRHSYMTMQTRWLIPDVSASHGMYGYHNTPDHQPYSELTCASITTPALKLATNSTLNFKARFDMEYQWDGVVQEISTDGGTTWNDLPPTGGYPTTFAQTMNPPINACGFASTHDAFSGVSTAASNANPNNATATAVFKPFAVDLAAYAGQTMQIRWRISSDPASGYLGFLLDAVKIGNGSGSRPTDVIFANGFEEGMTRDYMCH